VEYLPQYPREMGLNPASARVKMEKCVKSKKTLDINLLFAA
jgi:hypothetical protein